MHLLHVIGSMNPVSGGPCQVIRNSIFELEKLKFESEVACLDAPNAPFINHEPFKIHAFGPGKGPWCYCSSLANWLLTNLTYFDYLIIHGLWLYHSYAVHKAIQIIKLTHKNSKIPKVFIMPHGMLDPYFQSAPERRIKAIRNEIYWALIENKVVKSADAVLFTCEEERRLARVPFTRYMPKQEFCVGLGSSEPPHFDDRMTVAFRSKCDRVGLNPYFLFLGRLHPKKGIDLLIKAYEKLLSQSSEYKDSSIKDPSSLNTRNCEAEKAPALPKLVIAGPGLDSIFGREMQKLVRESNILEGKVFFTGMLTDDAKWGAFYNCEAFVLPSHQENFGIAVVEALACGKPVLISKEVNIWREIYQLGAAIVAEDTIIGVEELLYDWVKIPNEQKRDMGKNAKNAFNKCFSISESAKKLKEALLA